MMPTFSIVIETEDLGMAGIGDLEACLNSLMKQAYPISGIHEALLIVGGHMTRATLEHINTNYPPFPQELPLYRGRIPVWRKQLLAAGIKFYLDIGTPAHRKATAGFRRGR